jgi:hypothetical protein
MEFMSMALTWIPFFKGMTNDYAFEALISANSRVIPSCRI